MKLKARTSTKSLNPFPRPLKNPKKKQPKKSGGEITTIPSLAEGISHADAKLYCESLLMIYFEPASDSYYPPGPEYKKWIYSRYYPWSTWPQEEWKGHKPETQSTNGNLTYTIVVFLDETAFGSFQWIYMDVRGIWSTSTSGAGTNADYYLERGWSIECTEISIPTPVDNNVPLNYYDCSPKNVNNQKTATTSVGFDVDYKTGTFHFSESVTESIYDWKIVLNTINNWTYDQNSPYDGKQSWDEFPKDSVKYDAGKARHEIKLLPELSRKAIDFDTMSVWRNNMVSHNQICIMHYLRVEYGWEAIKNIWPTWSGFFWSEAKHTTEYLYVDLGQVT
ncbi:MAG: hypothetical protein HXS46_08555 [Theionarchaea archaeon]|nr:hypothetical protein [Theionarchaea archaeon]